MDFFEKFGETVYNTGKNLTDKAKEMAAIAELKNQINTCNTVIKKNYSMRKMDYDGLLLVVQLKVQVIDLQK